jgi:hypothetical protein
VLFPYWCILELVRNANILVRMYSSTVAPAKYYGYDIVMTECHEASTFHFPRALQKLTKTRNLSIYDILVGAEMATGSCLFIPFL